MKLGECDSVTDIRGTFGLRFLSENELVAFMGPLTRGDWAGVPFSLHILHFSTEINPALYHITGNAQLNRVII